MDDQEAQQALVAIALAVQHQSLLGQLQLTGAVGERERGWLKVDRKAE